MSHYSMFLFSVSVEQKQTLNHVAELPPFLFVKCY